MKIEKKEIEVYIADDGKTFFNKVECISYEEDKIIKDKRQEFLSKIILEEIKQMPNILEYYSLETLNKIYVIAEEKRTEFGWLKEDGSSCEFDEDSPFNINVFHQLEELIFIKYGYKIQDSCYYWPK